MFQSQTNNISPIKRGNKLVIQNTDIIFDLMVAEEQL
jgi:hypothetical protein